VLDSGEELVGYSTNGSSYGAMKIAEYLHNGGSAMPEDYHRYVKVQVEVLNRFPKESVDFNRRLVDLMEQQVNLLGSLRNQMESGRRAA